jgi:short-subunit dehydrogenase
MILQRLDIDILICNAAIGESGSMLEIPMDKVRNNFEVNVFSTFRVVQIIASKMLSKNTGKIILMSSLYGIMPIKFLGPYSASKASVIKMADAMRKELKVINSDLKVILVEPGMYHTGFNQVMLNNKYEWMEKESIFKEELETIRKQESLLTAIMEKKRLNSIVRKIVCAVKSKYPCFIYRAPLSQVILIKMYSLFFE